MPSWALCVAMLQPREPGHGELPVCLWGSGRGVPTLLGGLDRGSAASPRGSGRGRRLLSVTGETRQGNGAMRGGASAATCSSARRGTAAQAQLLPVPRGARGAGARRAVGLRVRATCGSGSRPRRYVRAPR